MRSEESNDNGPHGLPALKPEDIAEAIVYVLATGPNVQVYYFNLTITDNYF